MKIQSFFDFTIDDQSKPVLPDPQDSSVQIWHDYHGKECAYAYTNEGDYLLYFPYIASYRIAQSSNRIYAYPEPESNRNRIKDLYSRIVFPIALHTHGIQALHASAVLSNNSVIAFCAMSETGKSTTAYALSQRGYPQWADDAVPFEIQNEVVSVLPLEFESRIDANAEGHLGRNRNIAQKELSETNLIPLSVLIVLHRSTDPAGQNVKVKRLSAAEGFRSVLLHAHFFNLSSSELKRDMLSKYMKLTSLVPVFEVHFVPGFEKLPLLLDEIEGIIKRNQHI